MTARVVAPLASLLAALAVGACVSTVEVPVETPIQPKLDASPFQSVLVAGFVAAGSEEVDANVETVRLLRSQLRTKSGLKVVESDVLSLTDVAAQQARGAEGSGTPQEKAPAKQVKDEKDLETYESVFANTAYWKKLGEEFQGPLIVTGTVLFTPHAKAGYVQRESEVIDQYGRRSVQPVRTYMERKGYILQPKFVFIDGRTGATLYSERFREETLYNQGQEVPALSSYFELMDRLIPGFLGTLSSQKIRGTRVLLQ